jgi:hypothetical protein
LLVIQELKEKSSDLFFVKNCRFALQLSGFSKSKSFAMNITKIALTILILVFIGWLVKIIYEPIAFEKEKKYRYSHVIQRLKDIRTAQLAYKNVNNTFTGSFDTLVDFIKNGELAVVKQIGNVDDTSAVIIRDTIFVRVIDSLYTPKFIADSLPYVPFGDGAKFKMQAGEVERGNVMLKVFEVVDSKPFDPKKVLKVGSLTEPSNAGNWE